MTPIAPTPADATESPPYPGIPLVMDGSEAIASVETRIAEVACVYPITPSTTMAAVFQAAVADGARNLWGTPLRFIEREEEHWSLQGNSALRDDWAKAPTGRRSTSSTSPGQKDDSPVTSGMTAQPALKS